MNEKNVQQIFENYIEHFEEYNNADRNKISEYYKWGIIGPFRDVMVQALNGNSKDFSKQLDEIKNVTSDFIDSKKKWPLAGLKRLTAKDDGKSVQELFQALYAEDYNDLDKKQSKVDTFLKQVRPLEEQAGLTDQFKNDVNSVTKYLFLYDPDHNYVYKPMAAKRFAKYIDLDVDFGTGDDVKIKSYYQMCEQIVKEIEKNEKLKELESIRLKLLKKNFKEIWEDKKKHILAYDIIYCAYRYSLWDGITLVHLTEKEKKEQKVIEEKRQKAIELLEKLKLAQEEKKKLDEAWEAVDEAFCTGKNISYKNFGKNAPIQNGTIAKRNNNIVVINLEGENNKTVVLPDAVVNGYIWPQDEQEAAQLAGSIEILKNASMIKTNLSTAEREFAPYSDYI